MANNINIGGKNYDAEALGALKDVLDSARNMNLSLDQVAKMIEGNQRLMKTYEQINKTLRDSTKLYGTQRNTLDSIVKYNREIFKLTKADETTRRKINDITNKNRQFLDDIAIITEQIVRNDVDSETIKKEINKLDSVRVKNSLELQNATSGLKTGLKDISKFLRDPNNFDLLSAINPSEVDKALKASIDRYNKLVLQLDETDSPRKRETIQRKIEQELSSRADIFKNILDNAINPDDATEFIHEIETNLNSVLSSTLQGKNLEASKKFFGTMLKNVEESEERMQGIDRIFKTLQYTPLSSIFDFGDASSKMKDRLATGESLGGSAMGALGDSTHLGKLGAIGASAYILKEIVQLMAKADVRVTDLAKSFGVSKSEAGGLYQFMEDTATESGKLGVNIDDLIQSQLKFNTQFGYSVMLSNELLKTMTQNTKLIGLSEESNNSLLANSLFLNKEGKQVEDEILGTITMQSKGLANNKVVLEKVLSTSSSIKANFKGNYTEIAKSVTEAQRLGTTLEQIDAIGESMLNWESSIASELEAELLTGKQLNLEKARYASLTGDTATLMQEITSQVGSFEDFTNMNVIQQNAYATALGMTRKEMIDMLYQQKINANLIKIGNGDFKEEQLSFLSQSDKFKKEYSRIMNNNALSEQQKMMELGRISRENLSQLSAQQKFEEVLIKIKEKIAQIFGDGAILDKLANGLVGFMDKIGLIDESSAKSYYTATVIGNTGVKEGSQAYKDMEAKVSGYSTETIEGIANFQPIYAKNPNMSPNDARFLQFVKDSKFGYGEGLNMNEIKAKFDELINATKDTAKRPVSFDVNKLLPEVNQRNRPH